MESIVITATIRQPDAEIIAICTKDLKKYGCPYCGHKIGNTLNEGNGTAIWQCSDAQCSKICCVLSHGKIESVIGFYQGNILTYPKLQPHP